ncbi:hypothetical protein [Mycolicibacterium gilvum]|uniref:hypothetical protein n=1 Tax=Mycolicibacterium gilvum TaxID=1804 RepID=UPI0040454993
MIGSPGIALSQPSDEPPPPPEVMLSGQQLGMASQVSFTELNMTQKVTIPVPDGMFPTTLSGLLDSVRNIPSGFVEARTSDGRTLGSVPIPNPADGQAATPFTLNIGSVPVVRREAQVNLVLHVSEIETVCTPPPNLVLSNFSATFGGAMLLPTTIEEFLPAIAPVVDIFVDPLPTDAEKLTTLNLVTALTKHYQPATVPIFVRPLPRTEAVPPPDRDPAVRAIVIRDIDVPDPSVQLVTDAGPPFLVMAGRGEDLERQAWLLRDGLQKVAQTNLATVDSAEATWVGATNPSTFEQLGITGSASVLGEATIYLNLASALSTSATPGIVDVRLLANYTPVDEGEKGTMVVAIGDLVLTTERLDPSGRVDSRFSIPADVAARNQDLSISVRYSPGPGDCNPLTLPMNFAIDPMSATSIRPSGPVAMGGFAALPQGFIPKFQVAFDGSDPDELLHAATLVGLIQRASSTALVPEVVSLDQAASSDTSALIIANAQSVQDHNLDPPIDPNGNKSDIDLPSSAVIDISSGLATLQSYAQGNRTVVLLTTSGPWSLANPLFGYLTGLGQGWRELVGDVLVVGQAGATQNVTIRADGPTLLGTTPSDAFSTADVDQTSSTGRGWYEWTLLGAGILAALAVVGGGIYLLLKRSRVKGTTGQGGQTEETVDVG